MENITYTSELNHELLSCITGILGMTEVLSHESLTLQQHNYIKNIQRNSQQLLDLINQLVLPQPNALLQPSELTQKPKILLIEDDEIAQLATIHLLNELGYQVELAENGEEGLKIATKNTYYAILVDIGLPDIRGTQVIAKINQQQETTEHYTPLIAISAYPKAQIEAECMASGADKVMSKPLTREELKKLFGSYLFSKDASAAS